jgi:CRP/FNR family transcriptional regulator
MLDFKSLQAKFSYLSPDLLKEIIEHSPIQSFDSQTELVREGQYIKVIPIVISGIVKVFTRTDEKELLLYYILPDQSCIMSFSSALHNAKSKIVAVTEQKSTLLLLPADKVSKWIVNFPELNILFYNQYDLRYAELVDTLNHILHDKLDKRVFDYLSEKSKITGSKLIKISHKEIANDLGTAREVVSRIVKKMERESILKLHHESLELL